MGYLVFKNIYIKLVKLTVTNWIYFIENELDEIVNTILNRI